MKSKFTLLRLAVVSLVAVLAGSSVSCMTTYDANGRPVQSVDPGLAIAGVAAAGVLGYALADDNHHHHHGGYYGRPYYGRPHYHGGYHRRSGYARAYR